MARTRKAQLPYMTGEKGINRVRLYAHPKTGVLWVDCRVPERVRKSLGHRDVVRGKREADELALRLRNSEQVWPQEVTLGKLFDMYEREVTGRKSRGVQLHDRAARALFESCWGAATPVKNLDRRDWDRFIAERRSGVLRPAGSRRTTGVGDRQIEYDLRLLLAVCNWASTVRMGGEIMLDRNPFRGFPVPAELNIKQPVVTDPEIQALRKAAADVDELLPLFLELVYATGHRSVAVARLRWTDVDFEHGTLTWRAEHDKTGVAHVVPADPAVLELLQQARRRRLEIGDGWLFPAPADSSRPVSRFLLRQWWRRLERHAGLDRVPGRGWHSFRRRFATDLDGVPIKKVMALGGWKTMTSVLRYQRHTVDQLRDGLAERRRVASR